MTFHIGQKVVCIDDPPGYGAAKLPTGLVRNKIYTVSEIFGLMTNADGCCRITLVERRAAITNPQLIPRYSAGRFRPLIEKKSQTDISFALDILDRVSGARRVKEPV